MLKICLKDFPRHGFNASYAKAWNQVYANLKENSIVKIEDFSENYTCLLPHEIQSLHWTQNQYTVYPVVALCKINDEIKEDHFVVISDDIEHELKFVEIADIKIDEYYTQKDIVFENEIEFNDGCSSQYKSTLLYINIF